MKKMYTSQEMVDFFQSIGINATKDNEYSNVPTVRFDWQVSEKVPGFDFLPLICKQVYSGKIIVFVNTLEESFRHLIDHGLVSYKVSEECKEIKNKLRNMYILSEKAILAHINTAITVWNKQYEAMHEHMQGDKAILDSIMVLKGCTICEGAYDRAYLKIIHGPFTLKVDYNSATNVIGDSKILYGYNQIEHCKSTVLKDWENIISHWKV